MLDKLITCIVLVQYFVSDLAYCMS